MSKPYVGQIVEYRYKPNDKPLAAIVTVDRGDGWVALHCFSETSRWIPHVEYAVHCKPAAPEPEPQQGASSSGVAAYPFGIFP